jgi:hypothetical protein
MGRPQNRKFNQTIFVLTPLRGRHSEMRRHASRQFIAAEGPHGLSGIIEANALPAGDSRQVEADLHEEHNIGEMYNGVLGPVLKIVEEYKASLAKNPNAPAANMTRF